MEKDPIEDWFNEECYFNDDHFSKSYTPIQLQHATLEDFDEHEQPITVSQYFYVDNANNIRLTYPYYKHKLKRNQRIERICKQKNILEKNSFTFKRIHCFSDEASDANTIPNITQKAENLEKILNLYPAPSRVSDEIDDDAEFEIPTAAEPPNHFRIRHHHQVIYCQDEDQGFIMIFDTNMQESKEIAIVNMKDHYNVEVMDSKLIKELMEKI